MRFMTDNITLDSNVLIYAFSTPIDNRKAIAKDIISNCNIISLQVVNETVFVLQRKFKFTAKELGKIIEDMQNQQVIEGRLKIINPFKNQA